MNIESAASPGPHPQPGPDPQPATPEALPALLAGSTLSQAGAALAALQAGATVEEEQNQLPGERLLEIYARRATHLETKKATEHVAQLRLGIGELLTHLNASEAVRLVNQTPPAEHQFTLFLSYPGGALLGCLKTVSQARVGAERWRELWEGPLPHAQLIQRWRTRLGPDAPRWVLFENETCVLLREPSGQQHPHLQALELARLGSHPDVMMGQGKGGLRVVHVEPPLSWPEESHFLVGALLRGAVEAGTSALRLELLLEGKSRVLFWEQAAWTPMVAVERGLLCSLMQHILETAPLTWGEHRFRLRDGHDLEQLELERTDLKSR